MGYMDIVKGIQEKIYELSGKRFDTLTDYETMIDVVFAAADSGRETEVIWLLKGAMAMAFAHDSCMDYTKAQEKANQIEEGKTV